MKRINLNDILIVLIIVISPLLFYLYKIFPKSVLNKNFTNFGFDLDFDTVLWIFIVKLYLIILLTVWYFSCKNWWRISILIPLTIELFKIINLLNPNSIKYDEVDYIISMPVTIPIITIIIFLSMKLRVYCKSVYINELLNDEINFVFDEINVINEKLISEIEKEFEDLKMNKSNYGRKKYLSMLLSLRNKIK